MLPTILEKILSFLSFFWIGKIQAEKESIEADNEAHEKRRKAMRIIKDMSNDDVVKFMHKYQRK